MKGEDSNAEDQDLKNGKTGVVGNRKLLVKVARRLNGRCD